MPITREQFRQGLDESIQEWVEKLQEFLILHRDEAFTEQELRQEFGLPAFADPPSGDVLAFGWALESLLETDAIETRIVSGHRYYAVRMR